VNGPRTSERPVNWTDAAHPLWTWAQVVCSAVTVVPLWSAAHLPFTDLPQHVAAIGTLRHWWDPFASHPPGPRWYLLSRDERWALFKKIE
jgi:hypothetical protein